MKCRIIILGLILAAITSFSQTQKGFSTDQTKTYSIDTEKDRLKKLKNAIDIKFNAKNSKVTILVKTPDNKLIEVKNSKFPDEVEIEYNLFKDSLGKVILIKEIPYIESGDDYIEVTHYFDKNGKTFAITLIDNYFAEQGVEYWTKTTYFDTSFKEIGQDETLLDKNKKALKRNTNFEFPYSTEFNANKDLCLAIFNSMQKATLASTLPKVETFLIPDNDNNKVTYYMPTNTGGIGDATRILYYKRTAEGVDILDARFIQEQTTSIQTISVTFINNEARITKSISTNMFVKNKRELFSPSLTLLKVPPKDGTTSWIYSNPEGDKYSCVGSWSYDRVEENGEVREIPVIKVTKTTPELKGQIFEYYRKGYGLVRVQFKSTSGKVSTQFQLSSLSHDDEIDQINMFK